MRSRFQKNIFLRFKNNFCIEKFSVHKSNLMSYQLKAHLRTSLEYFSNAPFYLSDQ